MSKSKPIGDKSDENSFFFFMSNKLCATIWGRNDKSDQKKTEQKKGNERWSEMVIGTNARTYNVYKTVNLGKNCTT